jgi:uncharacterized protein DUF4105
VDFVVRASWLLVTGALAVLPCAAGAAAQGDHLSSLVEKSRQLRLAERPEWRKLVHYVPNAVAPGWHSLVDSPQFFNAADGKLDPRSELEATLASFYSGIEETPERQHPQCAFIARRAWLDRELGFDWNRMPRRECKRYRDWHAALNPKGLTLVFASAYLNNPGSMYGHTLLRIDAQDQNERTRLLAYTVNFAAATSETNGLAFAVNGLLGGYAGTFSVLPYYLKVREYSDMENRDLWEYELNLSPDDMERVLMHAWELLPAYFQYFFFDENCSYHLLGLLQVARPELELTAPFRLWALPSDTVRALTRQPGLVTRTVYRPANATIIGQRLNRMSGEERTIAKELSLRKASATDPRLRALPADRAAAVIETSHDYVNYRRATGEKDVAEPGGLARELLVARSRLDAPAQAADVPEPRVRPDQGHGSSRIVLGAGRHAGRDYQEVEARATYHDILDAGEGYPPGAQIEFFKLALRHDRSGATRVERFTPLEIASLSPRDEFFHSGSWRIEAGWKRAFVRDGAEPLIAGVEGGAGGAWSGLGGRATAYAMAEAAGRLHSDLEKGYSAGAGTRAGALIDATPRWRLHGHLQGLKYFLGERDTARSVGLQQRIAVDRDLALRLDLSRKSESGRTFNDGSLSVMLYF